MTIRTVVRDHLARFPRLDGQFRRHIWSRVHFPEAELGTLNALPRDAIDIAIDVGAALGGYCWVLERCAKQIYAFEPGLFHAKYLAQNIPKKITLVCAAVGDSGSQADMFTEKDDVEGRHTATLSLCNPIARRPNVRVCSVPQVTLDGYFCDKADPTRSIDLLKIDVEGYENAVLRGGVQLLESHHPIVICEIEARHNPEYTNAFDLLRNLGYRSYVMKNNRYELFDGRDVGPLQSEVALNMRSSQRKDPARAGYLNNFVFQHSNSRLQVVGRGT